MIAISPNKSKISVMRGSFDQEKLEDFLSSLINGRAVLDELKTKPVFKKVDKWDGKDAAPLEDVRFKLFKNNLIFNLRTLPTQTIFD